MYLGNQNQLVLSADRMPNLEATKKLLWSDKSIDKASKILSSTSYSKFWDPTFIKLTRNTDRVDKIMKWAQHRKSRNLFAFL